MSCRVALAVKATAGFEVLEEESSERKIPERKLFTRRFRSLIRDWISQRLEYSQPVDSPPDEFPGAAH
jgi:hypothetical protein